MSILFGCLANTEIIPKRRSCYNKQRFTLPIFRATEVYIDDLQLIDSKCLDVIK